MSHRGTKTNKSRVSKWVSKTQRHVWGLEPRGFVLLKLKIVRLEMAVLCKYVGPYCVAHYWLHKQSIENNGWSQRSTLCAQCESVLSWTIHSCLYLIVQVCSFTLKLQCVTFTCSLLSVTPKPSLDEITQHWLSWSAPQISRCIFQYLSLWILCLAQTQDSSAFKSVHDCCCSTIDGRIGQKKCRSYILQL